MPSKVVEEFPERTSLAARRPELLTLVGVTVKAGYKVKQGDVIGKITVGGMYRRRARTLATGTGFAVDSPVGKVEDASLFIAGDVLKNANGQTIGTVAANGVNTTANPDEITLTANAAVAVAAGAAVLGSDGSQVAKGISDDETDGTQDTPVAAVIGGYLDESKLLGLDATAKDELAGASVAGGVFKL